MIIYGSRSAFISNTPSLTAQCSNCDSEHSVSFSFFRRHAHIFWIPLFPIGKTGVSECSHCKQVLRKNEMPDRLKQEYIKAKKNAKGPLWQYSGLFLVAAVFILAGTLGSLGSLGKKNEAKYIAAPAVGDIYSYITEANQYSTMKVDSISNDSVFVLLNNYEIGKKSRIYKIEKPERYSENIYAYSKKEIQTLYDEKTIIAINR